MVNPHQVEDSRSEDLALHREALLLASLDDPDPTKLALGDSVPLPHCSIVEAPRDVLGRASLTRQDPTEGALKRMRWLRRSRRRGSDA